MDPRTPCSIRQAGTADREALADIAWQAKASLGYPREQLEAWRADLTPLPPAWPDLPTYVLELDEIAAGFYQLKIEGATARLEHLWVLPRYMRKGLGSALLAHAIRFAKQSGAGTLHIDSEPRAEAFYKKSGAVRVGAVAAPIAGDDARVRPQLCLDLTA